MHPLHARLEPPPSLPDEIARAFPFPRKVLRFQSGLDEGKTMHLVDRGEGKRIVLMQHGNPTWSYLWRKVILGLDPSEFRCIAPDLLGFGYSSKLPRVEDHSIARHADALSTLVEALDLRKIILVGQDWGGPILTSLGARIPDRIAGVVLANTSVLTPKKPRGTWFHRFSHAPFVSDLAFRALGFPLHALNAVQGDKSSLFGAAGKAYRVPLSSLRDRIGPLALARMVPNSITHPSVAELRRGEAWIRGFGGPMHLVWGEKDPILGRALKHHIRAFPDVPVVRTDAGHFLQEETPEALSKAIQYVHQMLENGGKP